MSPFLTFAICLSIAYLLYYGANIGKDLYATGKQLTSNEEVFEIEDVPVETAVSVNEQGDGFFIGDAEPEETAEMLDPEKESEKKETAETERRIASLQENLDKADVVSEYGITAPELHELLEGKKTSLFKPEMHDYVVTMMLYVLYLTYAIAALVTIYASLQIFIKMNAGEEGIVKEILMVVGACMFMIGASIVFPAFFGYQV